MKQNGKVMSIFVSIILCLTACFVMASCDLSSNENAKENTNKDTTPTYTVTFIYNNGLENYVVTLEKGSKVTEVEQPTKMPTQTEEYEFLGWYNGNVLWDFDADVVNKAVTLKAKWQAKPIAQVINYVVTFDSAGGSAVEQQSVDEGGKVIKPSDPTRASTATEEYEFLGWYLGEEEWGFDIDMVTQDITLTAKWKSKTYTGDLPIRR